MNSKFVHTIGRYWFFILIAVFFLWGIFTGAFNADTTSPSLPAPSQDTSNIPAAITTTNPISLTNGTILKSRSAYLSGDGELTISNGTDGDAVIKLIHGGTSIFTVYIQKGQSYTIQNITDGNYRVAFDQGINWDSTSGTFTNDEGSQFFEDNLDFETSDSKYTSYSITLNPVEGGTAQTDTLNSNQFTQY